ncbi:MAG: DAK2 domain-containing protein [Acidimicrobiales bacterium]
MAEALTVHQLREVMATFAQLLEQHKAVINALNVYPVPDGDTGTNMTLTVTSVVAELDGVAEADDVAAVCKAISHRSLMGPGATRRDPVADPARDRRGGARRRGGDDRPRRARPGAGPRLGRRLRRGAQAGRGTILTVVREASEGRRRRRRRGHARRRAGGGAPPAAPALARTPDLLPVLAEAGVVDAGGTGLLLLLDAALGVADGRPLPEPPAVASVAAVEHGAHHDHDGDGLADLRYEVMFFLEAPDETIAAFKDVWAGIGDSIVVVGGDGLWNCHIHTDDIGASIEAAIDCGRPRDIRVTDLMEQVEEERWVREAAVEHDDRPAQADEPVGCAVVAVATGAGVSRIFHSLGVQRMVRGGQTMNPSTAELLEAVESAPADDVVLLPNNKNIIPVAEQVDAQTAKTVRVVPTTGIAEAFASLLSYDPEATADDNAAAMAEAADAVVAGEVTQAVRDSTCELGPIATGDWLGIGRDGIKAVTGALDETCVRLLDALVADDHELVTIIEGDGASDAVTRHCTVWLAEHRPDVGTEVHHGGQPLYPYLFGIE